MSQENKDLDKQKDVVGAIVYANQSNCYAAVAVYFTDFQAVALLPDNSGTNYVTTTLRDNKTPERTYASNVKNMTPSQVTTTQNVSTAWASSVTSTVSGSETYSFAEAIKVGVEANFKVAKISEEFTFTATQAFTSGWSEGKTESKSGTIAETVSVSLPPCTNVLLEQGSSSTAAETKYNCPIGLKYKVILMPLAIVKIQPPDVNFVGGEQLNYNNLNYLHADMKVGDSSYTAYLKLRGENAFGVEYYGFSYRNGHWIVVKPDGSEWTDETAPVKLSRDAASGYMRYTAVKPGTCYLKYIIDENCYSTVSDIFTRWISTATMRTPSARCPARTAALFRAAARRHRSAKQSHRKSPEGGIDPLLRAIVFSCY